MQISSVDLVTLLTTELGRLIVMFYFFHITIKPIKTDVHGMASQINKIFVKLGKQDTMEKQIERMEDRIHSLELHRNKCPMK